MVLAFQPGSPGSNSVQTLYFFHAFIHSFFVTNFICKNVHLHMSELGLWSPSIHKSTDSGILIPLPDMPILGSSSSTANKDMMSKVWTNGDTVI